MASLGLVTLPSPLIYAYGPLCWIPTSQSKEWTIHPKVRSKIIFQASGFVGRVLCPIQMFFKFLKIP